MERDTVQGSGDGQLDVAAAEAGFAALLLSSSWPGPGMPSQLALARNRRP
jgi:hypothetical protein